MGSRRDRGTRCGKNHVRKHTGHSTTQVIVVILLHSEWDITTNVLCTVLPELLDDRCPQRKIKMTTMTIYHLQCGKHQVARTFSCSNFHHTHTALSIALSASSTSLPEKTVSCNSSRLPYVINNLSPEQTYILFLFF